MGQCILKWFRSNISSKSTHTVVEDEAKQTTISLKPLRTRIVQNFTLVWLDSDIDECDANFKNSLTQLRRIINTINTFTDPDQCKNFLTKIKNEKAFMIVSGALSQSIVPIIHDLSQLDSIYVFCSNESEYEQWALKWTKIKGVFTQIETICNVLKRDTQRCNHDSILISVTSKDLNHLEPSFMYTQLLKEIFLDMEYDDNAKTELVEFCREQYYDNPEELEIIDEFERDYHVHTPIWWYTYECFTYQMLNRALHTQDIEILIKMGFFLRDIHRQIEKLHSKIKKRKIMIVYRGKTMSNAEFDEIKKKQDGLLAFNSFLSTSLNKDVSLEFATMSLENPEMVGVLFQITVDPSISSTPFAPVSKISAVPDEKEVLFSMHSIFRIGQISQIEDRIWRVELRSTNDDDQDLKRLTEHIRQETSDSTKWQRLGNLLIKMGKFDKAEEIFQVLLEKTFKNNEKMHSSLYFHLGDIKCSKGDYKEALEFYQKSLKIRQKYPISNPSDLVNDYNSIGLMHNKMGEYTKALEFYLKSLEIGEKSLPSNEIDLAEICNNIGAAYCHIGEDTKAIEFYQKSLDICLKSFPSNPADLTNADSNIVQVDHRMQEYSKAIEAYQKTLEIRQKTLPPNHPDLATIYNSIGLLHSYVGEYPKALEVFHKDLQIKEKSLPHDHPDFAIAYNNIGLVHSNTREHAKALEFYHKSLEISLKSLPSNHPDLATTYNNIGLLHSTLGDYHQR